MNSRKTFLKDNCKLKNAKCKVQNNKCRFRAQGARDNRIIAK
jgi:hypothetical protein